MLTPIPQLVILGQYLCSDIAQLIVVNHVFMRHDRDVGKLENNSCITFVKTFEYLKAVRPKALEVEVQTWS